MGRTISSFERRRPYITPHPKILILCEDSKSAKNYFEDVSRHFRVNVHVRVAHCGYTDPLGIVRTAISEQAQYEQIFCAIDRDRHETFQAAIDLAKTSPKVTVTVSYPCFEFWYLIHFGFCNKPYVAEGNNSPCICLIKDLRNKPGMENYDKGSTDSIFELLGPDRLRTARLISPNILRQAHRLEDMNPSTNIHELIDVLEKLAATN